MNILLLSNNAPNYHYFFNHLALLLTQDGAKVSVAVDSPLSRENNKLDLLEFPVYDFTEFFSNHEIDYITLERYSNYNLNSMLLSDFERAQVYNIWNEKEDDYFDRLKSALLCFYERIINEKKIHIILYENVSNTFSHLAWVVAQVNGLKYIGIGGSRLPGRFSITSDPLNDERPEIFYSAIVSGKIEVSSEVKRWAENYLDNIESIVPDYMKINGLDNVNLLKRYFRKEKFETIFKLIKHARDDSHHAFQAGNPLITYFNLFKRNIARKIRIKIIKNSYDKIPEGESFLLYPMHFHPESSTSILSGTYLDEYEVIRNIAFNLPNGVKLYVKDHISAWGYPELEFYKKIKALPNVRLLHPGEQTKKLIKASLAVITLTSTVGYEALLLGKKVFLYGRVFYEFHENVVKIESPSELFKLFNEHLNNPDCFDRNYALNFLASYYLSTYPGSMNMMLKDKQAYLKADEIYRNVLKEIVFNNIDAVKNEIVWL